MSFARIPIHSKPITFYYNRIDVSIKEVSKGVHNTFGYAYQPNLFCCWGKLIKNCK